MMRDQERREELPSLTSGECSTDLNVTIHDYDLPEMIEDVFDRQTWEVTEACLAVHVSLLIEGAECLGLMIVGPSGSGKTTALRFIEDSSQVHRADSVTPAAFVSHDATLDKEELAEVDLLPKIRHKTLFGRDMSIWFSGLRETVEEQMATVANVLDGDGLMRSTGAHGSLGYQGDYRFTFIGATTPLAPRAWDAMGHVGNRFVFHQMTNTKSDEEIVDAVFSENKYEDKIQIGCDLVSTYLRNLWDDAGGYAALEWPKLPAEEIQDAIQRLGKLVAHARAPVIDETAQVEGQLRITSSLFNLARGRAILDGRTHVTRDDLSVIGRVALSTMPQKRRPLVRELINPSTSSTLRTQDVQDALDMSDKTAKQRMELLDTLSLGNFVEGSGSDSHSVTLLEEFQWPDVVMFPEN